MRAIPNKKYFCLISLILYSTTSYAEYLEDSHSSLFMLSLDELLKVKVSSATKVADVALQKVPSVVRVFTRRMIEQQGYSTLVDLLLQVPGVQIQEYRAGHQLAWFRGVQSRYNSKVLWLVDGVPIRNSYYGNHLIDDYLSLEFVERVEIISGPGSVLYGANAFAGVVSITTRKDASSINLRKGSHDTNQAGLQYAWKNAYAFVDKYSTGGLFPELKSDGKPFVHPQDADKTSTYLSVFDENISTTLSITDYKYTDTYRKSGRYRKHQVKPQYFSAQYKKELNSTNQFKALAYYEEYNYSRLEYQYNEDLSLKSLDEEVLNTSLYGLDFEVTQYYKAHTLVSGFSHQVDQDNGIAAVDLFPIYQRRNNLSKPNVSRQTSGIFIQDIWNVTESYSLTSAVRYDWQSDFDNELSYRVGLTYDDAKYYTKFMVGSAYRVPTYREYIDVLSHNKELTPEHLLTFELQWGMKQQRSDINLTLYHNDYSDFIKELNVDSILDGPLIREIDDEYSINAEQVLVTGFELLWHYSPSDTLQWRFGFSHIFSGKEKIGDIDSKIVLNEPELFNGARKDLLYLAKNTANSAITYKVNDDWQLGVNFIYLSERPVSEIYQNSVPVEFQNKKNNQAFNRIDLNANWRVNNAFNLSIKINNLFDTNIYSPPADKPDGYDQEWFGQLIEFKLRYNF